MRGRKPRPTHLKLLEGNPGKRPINRSEPKPASPLFRAPPSISTPEQRALWSFVIRNAPRGLLRSLDRELLAVWVGAASMHSEALQRVGEFGLMTKSPTKGVPMQNPWLAIVNRQAEIMMRAAVEMGFTPSSRSRITIKEGDLAEPDNVFEEFQRDS